MGNVKFVNAAGELSGLRLNAFHSAVVPSIAFSSFGNYTSHLRGSATEIYEAFEGPRRQTARILESMSEVARVMQSHLVPMKDAMHPLLAEVGPWAHMRSHQRLLEKAFTGDKFSELRSSSRFFEGLLEHSDVMRKAATFKLPDARSLATALSPLHDQYGSWLGDITAKATPTLEHMTPVIAVPSEEMIRTYEDVDVLLGGAVDEEAKESSANLPKLEELLHGLSPALLPSYRAVVDGLRKRGDDYQRHVGVSLRTLLDHAFLAIAPNTAIAAYLASQGQTMSGPAGWGLRVQVSLYSLGQPTFINFMEERAAVMKISVRIIQKSIHELGSLQSAAAFEHFVNNAMSSLQGILEARHLALVRL